MLYIAAASWVKVATWVGVAFKLESSGSRCWLSRVVQDNFFLRLNQKKWSNEMMVLEHVSLEPEIRQHQEFVEKSCGGQLSNRFQPTIVRKHRTGQLFPTHTQEILSKTINSWKTLARPMFSMNFYETTMEKHWPGQCFP